MRLASTGCIAGTVLKIAAMAVFGVNADTVLWAIDYHCLGGRKMTFLKEVQ